PIELWAFNTTAEDARIRNELYKRIGANETRNLLAMLYPNGSAARVIEQRLEQRKARHTDKPTTDADALGIIDELIQEILSVYQSLPNHQLRPDAHPPPHLDDATPQLNKATDTTEAEAPAPERAPSQTAPSDTPT